MEIDNKDVANIAALPVRIHARQLRPDEKRTEVCMNAKLLAVEHAPADDTVPESDAGTRQRVLQIVAAAGPVSAAELAAQLDLAPAGIRRHLGVLEATDQITVHGGTSVPKGRGRPARRYAVTRPRSRTGTPSWPARRCASSPRPPGHRPCRDSRSSASVTSRSGTRRRSPLRGTTSPSASASWPTGSPTTGTPPPRGRSPAA